MPVKNFLFRHKHILYPHSGYTHHQCFLIQYDVPLLKYCFILCADESVKHSDHLASFALQEAQRLSQHYLQHEQHFILIYSGSLIRRRHNWHAHIFLVEHRWQKALVYQMLAIKNFALSLLPK